MVQPSEAGYSHKESHQEMESPAIIVLGVCVSSVVMRKRYHDNWGEIEKEI